MFKYIVRRLLYAIPIVLGVMMITFALFYLLQKPDAMARRILGPKASQQAVDNWIKQRGYDKPVFVNLTKGANPLDSQFVNYIESLATFQLGVSDVTGQPVIERFKEGAIPSLTITVPAFFLGLALAQSGRFAEARNLWADLLQRAPAGAPWCGDLQNRLARLDALIAQQQRMQGQPGTMP